MCINDKVHGLNNVKHCVVKFLGYKIRLDDLTTPLCQLSNKLGEPAVAIVNKIFHLSFDDTPKGKSNQELFVVLISPSFSKHFSIVTYNAVIAK